MKHFFTLLPLAAACCVLGSCSSSSDAFDENGISNQKKAEYNAAFVKEFGAIAANQDWGFGSSTKSTVAFAKTRSSNANSNQWGDYVDVPGGYTGSVPNGNATSEEIEKVRQAFSVKTTEDNAINVNWSDFFVQQIYKGTASYTAKNGGTVTGSQQMDYLTCGDNDEHINNFNNGNNTSNHGLMLMQESSTSKFGYHNSLDNNMHYEYIIKEIDGNYYVGFDFYANGSNTNQQVERDYIYNDWIVKISPATYTSAQRIIAEDLGTIGDFDFNDVVLDVAQYGGQSVITVQAAGGTLPLYVQIGDKEQEVHEALGTATSTMVNTNTGSVSKPVAIFRLPSYSNLESDVKLYVKNGSSKVYLDTNIGEAPAKICVKTTYKWTDERVKISTKYPKFNDYVSDKTVKWYGE